jgi:hypothetical protein
VYLGRWDKFCFEETLLISFLYLSHWHRNSEVSVSFSFLNPVLTPRTSWKVMTSDQSQMPAWVQREQIDRESKLTERQISWTQREQSLNMG